MNRAKRIGELAIAHKGWWAGNKWLLLRRSSQLSILGLFLLGPWAGIWVVKGNLNSSLTLDILPLTDPYVLLQGLFAGHVMESKALLGALIVAVFYMLVGGRVYCSWVCPVNIVTDAAHWLRVKFRVTTSMRLSGSTRYWLLGTTFIVAALTGTLAWEWVNPVSMLHRGLIFSLGTAWTIILAVFLFDLLMTKRGWCSHLCPVGAFYSLIGKAGLIRVSAVDRVRCNDCADCYAVCPEQHILKPALKGAADSSPIIFSPNCTNCGRCIDVCSEDVFCFTSRFDKLNLTVTHKQVI
jgi:ferredoxin-type protein NapH